MTPAELDEIEARLDRATFEDEVAECAQDIPALCAEVRRLRAHLESFKRRGYEFCIETNDAEIDKILAGDPAP